MPSDEVAVAIDVLSKKFLRLVLFIK